MAKESPDHPAGDRRIGEVPAGGKSAPTAIPPEIGGPKGPEPTRYGDWEIGGRCSDF
jgi:hypothetical protein